MFNRHDESLPGYVLAVVDQGVLSAGRFMVGMALALALTPTDYGVFVLWYGAYFFFASIHSALINQPLMLCGSPLDLSTFRRYVAGTARVHWQFSIIFSLTVILFARLLSDPFGPLPGWVFRHSLVIVPAFVCMWTQGLVRAIHLARLSPARALASDICFMATQGIGVIMLIRAGNVSTPAVFAWIGVAGACGALFMLRGMLRPVLSFGERDPGAARANFQLGRWLAATTVAYWASSQIAFFASAGLIGAAATGTLKACQNLVAPTHLVLMGLDGMIAPIAARRLASNGRNGMNDFLKRFGVLVVGLTTLYCLAVTLFSDRLLDLVYRGKYSGHSAVVALLAIQYVGLALAQPFATGLKLLGQPKRVFRAYALAALLALCTAAPLSAAFGLPGAALAATLATAATSVSLAFMYRRAIAGIEASFRPLPVVSAEASSEVGGLE